MPELNNILQNIIKISSINKYWFEWIQTNLEPYKILENSQILLNSYYRLFCSSNVLYYTLISILEETKEENRESNIDSFFDETNNLKLTKVFISNINYFLELSNFIKDFEIENLARKGTLADIQYEKIVEYHSTIIDDILEETKKDVHFIFLNINEYDNELKIITKIVPTIDQMKNIEYMYKLCMSEIYELKQYGIDHIKHYIDDFYSKENEIHNRIKKIIKSYEDFFDAYTSENIDLVKQLNLIMYVNSSIEDLNSKIENFRSDIKNGKPLIIDDNKFDNKREKLKVTIFSLLALLVSGLSLIGDITYTIPFLNREINISPIVFIFVVIIAIYYYKRKINKNKL